MTSEQIWITTRRALGVYFVVTGLTTAPQIFLAFTVEMPEGTNRWWMPMTVAGQAGILLIAGWWLARRAAIGAEIVDAGWLLGALKIVLQVLGVYFVVSGLVSVVEWSAALMLVERSWFSVQHFAGAAAMLAAGLVLVARPTAVAQRIAAFP